MTRRPLDTLRLRLTAWYALTLCAIIAVLGAGLFVAVRRQLSAQLDDSLVKAAAELVRAAHIRAIEAAASHGEVVDAVDELRIPDRNLYLLDARGRPVKPEQAPAWLGDVAVRATHAGRLDGERAVGGDASLRFHAERFRLDDGTPLVAVAVADQEELEDRYAALIAAFGAAASVAVVLVAVGGWLLVRQSTRPVERSMEQMRRFMADAAHELRTPLTVLRSRAEVALQQPREPAAYVAALRGIDAESERLGGIVDDLLTLARADAGERPIERERIYLDDVALDAAGAARVVAEGKGVTLSVPEFEEAVVEGDARLLRQLVMILLDNAVKFTPAGGTVRVRVGTPEGLPTLVVEDSGVGIAPERLPHVFERFYRADPARGRGDDAPASDAADRRGGAGLGLSIAEWIARAHGGTVTLDSREGEGTVARVELPAPPAGAPDSERAAPSSTPGHAPRRVSSP